MIDRDKASALGVTANQIEDALYSAYGLRQVSTIFAPNNQYRVILELEPQYQRDANALSSLYVRSKSGQLVPLSAVAKLTQHLRPAFGEPPRPASRGDHFVQPEAGNFDRRCGERDQRTGAAARFRQRSAPAFRATRRPFSPRLSGLGMLLLMAILVIYIVLGILYESFIHPITILSGLPSAGFGALLTLELFHIAAQKGWISPLLDMELGHLRLRRHHHADRHREEKRHHDDRLRAGGAAQRGQGRPRKRSTRVAWCGSGRS